MTPSASITNYNIEVQVVTDSDGRRLALRRLSALDKLRLFKAAGPLLSQNQPWLGMAMLACCVAAIDEIPVPQPVTEQQIESMINRLGDCGLAAIAGTLREDTEPSPTELAANAGN